MNAHLAHNDIYVALFCSLAVLILLKYQETANRLWLYATFFTVGLAASSKYNGGVLVFAPFIVYLITERKVLFKDLLRTIETLFISAALCFSGNPKSPYLDGILFQAGASIP
jgi:4-amino-4-deoxy-L-arabinose transferase-like glycosyltransferase